MRFGRLLGLQMRESARHSRWLLAALLAGLMLCFVVLLRAAEEMYPYFFESFSAHYESAHVTLSFSAPSPEALEEAQRLLEAESMVDYYLLTDRFADTSDSVTYDPYGNPLRTINSVSAVWRVETQPEGNLFFRLAPIYGVLCDTPDGEPAPGTVYFGYNLNLDDETDSGWRIGQPAMVGGQSLVYQCTLNTVEVDALVSQEDFAGYGTANELTYVVSPFATRRGIDRLNARLQEMLPHAKATVSFTPLWQRVAHSTQAWDVRTWLLLCAAVLFACLLLFSRILMRKDRTLSLVRLMGCHRLRLAAATVLEMELYTLGVYVLIIGGYLVYQVILGRTLRAMLLGVCTTVPLLGIFLLFGAVTSLVGVCRVVNRVPVSYRTAE